ncbi:MAG: peroxidase [Gemmatimonadetes bacterium]|nr:peroxidase [Gemmatimonadota bacterium]
MAYIEYRNPSALPASYQRLHDRLADDEGIVDNVVRIHSVNPPAMRHHIQLYEHAMRGPSPLSEIQRELIAITVSAANDCFY